MREQNVSLLGAKRKDPDARASQAGACADRPAGEEGDRAILRDRQEATPQVRALLERYGADVAFSFDSNGRSV